MPFIQFVSTAHSIAHAHFLALSTDFVRHTVRHVVFKQEPLRRSHVAANPHKQIKICEEGHDRWLCN